jgi:hypothetical protein
MEGFPPSPEAQVTLANWRTAPFNRWAFHHVREIVPTADVPNDPLRAREFETAPIDLEALRIESTHGPRSLVQFLDETSTDGFIVVADGRIAFERYTGGMTAESPHILMSVSKSMLGLLAGVLVHRGDLDPARLVTDVIPEVTRTAYRGATIRHLLDMRAGIAFEENYLVLRRADRLVRTARRSLQLRLTQHRSARVGDRARHGPALRRPPERAALEADGRDQERLHHGRSPGRATLRGWTVRHGSRSRPRRPAHHRWRVAQRRRDPARALARRPRARRRRGGVGDGQRRRVLSRSGSTGSTSSSTAPSGSPSPRCRPSHCRWTMRVLRSPCARPTRSDNGWPSGGAGSQPPLGQTPHERAEGFPTGASPPWWAVDSVMALAAISYDRRRAG